MGVQSKTEIQQRSFIVSSNTRPINMKAFVAMLATVAAAAAEPWLGYGYAGLPLVYGKSAPCVNAANQSVPCAAGHVLLGKRDAEAEPWLGYGYGVPLVYGKSAPCVNAANQPVPLAAGHVLLGKREAEAESDPTVPEKLFAKREAEAESDPTLYFVNPLGARYGHPTNGFGQELVHSSNLGICTNYLGQRVPGLGC